MGMDVDEYVVKLLKDAKFRECDKLVMKLKGDLGKLGIAMHKSCQMDQVHYFESCCLTADQMSLILKPGGDG